MGVGGKPEIMISELRAKRPIFTTPGPIIVSRFLFFFSSRRRHTRCSRDWSSDVCSSDLGASSERQPLADFRDDLLGGLRGVHGDGIRGFLKIGELAGKDLLVGEMAVAVTDSFGEECVIPF